MKVEILDFREGLNQGQTVVYLLGLDNLRIMCFEFRNCLACLNFGKFGLQNFQTLIFIIILGFENLKNVQTR